jgi:LacI family transcriptional regulator
MKQPRVTMRDVARLAGVSVGTVSAAVNGTAGVSAASRKRVADAMEALHYRPDEVARSLKVGKTHVIGVVVPDITNLFYPEVVRGVEDAAQADGYSVILCNSNEDRERERKHLDILLSRRVDGVLLTFSEDSLEYEHLEHQGFPFVCVDRVPFQGRHWSVSTDNVEAGWRAAWHLIELGHKRIAAIAGNTTLSPHRDRVEGYRKALRQGGLEWRDDLLRVGAQQIETGYEAAKELLHLDPPPTAILSTNNRMLLGVMRALADLDLACPSQVSVIGFDDYSWTRHHTPKLTVMAQPTYQMGRRAMDLLLRQIAQQSENEGIEPQSVLLNAELRIRESTARPGRGGAFTTRRAG